MGFSYANEYTRHGVCLPGAAYSNASTHAHVFLLWSWLSINDLQGYNFESLKPNAFFCSRATELCTLFRRSHYIIFFLHPQEPPI